MPYTAQVAGTVSLPIFHYLSGNPVIVVGTSGSGGGTTPNPKTSGVKKGI